MRHVLLVSTIALLTACVAAPPETVPIASKSDAAESATSSTPRPAPFKPIIVVPSPAPLAPPADAGPIDVLSGNGARIDHVLLALFADSGLNYVVDDDVEGTRSFDLHDTTHEHAFVSLLESFGLSHRFEEGVVVIAHREQRTFDLDALAAAAGAAGADSRFWRQLTSDIESQVAGDGRVLISPVARTVEVEAPPDTVAKVEGYLDTVMRWVSSAGRREAELGEEYDYALLGAGSLFPVVELPPTSPHEAITREGLALASMRRAIDAVLARQRHRALELFEEALALDPTLADAHTWSAILELRAHELDRARAHLDQALLRRPDDPTALTLRGLVDLRRGHVGSAIDDLERVHLARPSEIAASNLAAVLMAAGRHENARGVLMTIDPARTKHPQPHLNLAYLHLLAGELGSAESELQRADHRGASASDPRMMALRALATEFRAFGTLNLEVAEPSHDPSDDVPATFLEGWH